MNRLLKALSNRLLRLKRLTYLTSRKILFKIVPNKVICNICGWKDSKFDSDGWHPNTVCPNCQSQIRQRLFWAVVNTSEFLGVNKLIRNKNVLHFAPDECLKKQISQLSKTYKTADFLTEGYYYGKIDLNIDMSNMKEVANDSFDCVIAFDVLEHIPNHLESLKEVYRILTPGGYCIFTIPQKDHLEETLEDLNEIDPAERERKFGQKDHWRIYGNDFKNMIEAAGFNVTVADEHFASQESVEKNVLVPPILSKHPMATNFRKIYFGEKSTD